jgi:hypothetical protein
VRVVACLTLGWNIRFVLVCCVLLACLAGLIDCADHAHATHRLVRTQIDLISVKQRREGGVAYVVCDESGLPTHISKPNHPPTHPTPNQPTHQAQIHPNPYSTTTTSTKQTIQTFQMS